MAARKKRKAKSRSPAPRGVSRSSKQQKRKSNGRVKGRSTTAKPSRTVKRAATRGGSNRKRAARNVSARTRAKKSPARSSKRLRETVERATRSKLKRNKQGGLREYQGPKFGQTKFGGYKEALKRVGDESQHAYDEAVESLREALDNDASEATIKRRRNKVRRLKK